MATERAVNLEPEHDGKVSILVSSARREDWDLDTMLPPELEITDLHLARDAIKLRLRLLVRLYAVVVNTCTAFIAFELFGGVF